MFLKRVESSNIEAVGYDETTAELFVLFKNKGLYSYKGVPAGEFPLLRGADSVGKYLNTNIKKVYESEHIWDDDARYNEIVSNIEEPTNEDLPE